MEIGHKYHDEILEIDLFGELFSEKIPFLEFKLSELISTVDKVIINCEELIYIDSKGLGMIIKILKLIREKKGELLICSVQGKVKKVFELTRFDRYITIHKDIEEALNHFES